MKNITTHVWYKTVDKDDNVIKDYPDEVCFVRVMRRKIDKAVNKIVIYSKDYQTNYTKTKYKKWIELIKSFGFELEYEGFGTGKYGTAKDEHVITIPIGDKSKNRYRAYFNTLFMFVRCLTEKYTEIIPRKYWELEKQFKIKDLNDKFELMQFVHQYSAGASNHQIRGCTAMKCLSLKEFFKRVDAKRELISGISNSYEFYAVKIDINDLWKGEIMNQEKNFEAVRSEKKIKVMCVAGWNEYANWLPVPYELVDSVEEADLVVFEGGTDSSPELFGEPRGKYTGSDIQRDKREIAIFKKARKLGRKFVGLCRGSQILCRLSGGTLVQHQDNPSYYHSVKSNKYGEFVINSTHHQAQAPYANLKPWDYRLIAWTEGLSNTHLDGNNQEMDVVKEAEIVYYPNTDALCIQSHPESRDFQRDYPESLKVIQQIFLDFMGNKL